MQRLDDVILIDFCANVGKFSKKIVALEMKVHIPISEEESKVALAVAEEPQEE